jgi:hypothetical protein
MLYGACKMTSPQLFDCETRIPMISSVICLPGYDRIVCFLFMFFSYSCQQVNIRANYKKLYGKIPNSTNDFLLYTGIVSVVSLPAIAFVDEHIAMPVHGVIAVIIFLSIGTYAYSIAQAMDQNRAKFDASMQSEIDLCKTVANMLILSLVGLALAAAIMGTGWFYTPVMEWVTTYFYLNYFAILAFSNNYYSSVHAESTKIQH